MKTSLLNPEQADIWIKPYRTDDSAYVKVASAAIYVTGGWYMVRFTCTGPTQRKPIFINTGAWEIEFKCDPKQPDGFHMEELPPPGPIEIVG